MLTTTRKPKEKMIFLEGAVDGSEDFEQLLGPLAPDTVLDAGGITQINSTGIKAWIRYFCDPSKKGLGLKFVNFAVPLVEQLNMLRNFAGQVRIDSIALPFRCKPCAHPFNLSFGVPELGDFRTQKRTVPCPLCGKPAEFDDVAEEYFEFLDRS
jgi:hypothetical protein